METATALNVRTQEETQELLPGKYMVEVNMDNSKIGSATLELE